MQIAIDGPSGAGKSSLARNLAQRLDVRYVDTGAMYRGLAYMALQKNVDLKDEAGLCRLCEKMDMQLRWDDKGVQHVYVAGQDLSEAIRREEVSQAASEIAGHAGVRREMVAAQQALAQREDIVMDGRDIGSVVLPGADIKFFVTADLDTRARRRLAQLKRKEPSKEFSLEEVAKELQARDENDTEREVTPLVQLEDAILIDTSNESLFATVDRMIAVMKKKGVLKQDGKEG